MVNVLNAVFSAFDVLCNLHDVYKVETVGPVYMIVGGCPQPAINHAEQMAHLGTPLATDSASGGRVPVTCARRGDVDLAACQHVCVCLQHWTCASRCRPCGKPSLLSWGLGQKSWICGSGCTAGPSLQA